jgi:hypothetical protein
LSEWCCQESQIPLLAVAGRKSKIASDKSRSAAVVQRIAAQKKRKAGDNTLFEGLQVGQKLHFKNNGWSYLAVTNKRRPKVMQNPHEVMRQLGARASAFHPQVLNAIQAGFWVKATRNGG